ncbi:MAG: metallophosphoesterase family protein, partial [Spirochaetales bacterium]|nr:metallophosphoesterase family protein [Spirochaetales bacterium]
LLLMLALVLGLCACKQEPGQEHEHTFSEAWTSDGQYHWHAATCEHSDVKDSYGAHVLGNKEVVKEVSCTENGSEKAICSVCGATVVETIQATGHTFSDEWNHDSNYHWHLSTCEHEGLKGSFGPHRWGSGTVTKAPTCTEEGEITYSCECGATKTESIPCHSFSANWTSDDDYHWHAATCEHTDQVSERAEHSFGVGVDNGNGTVTVTCKICGEKVTKDLPSTVSLVMAGPGEDSSNSAVISWHSTGTGSWLEFTDADGEVFSNSIANDQCNETLSTADWRDASGDALISSHYRCKVYLDGLTPGSTYKYRIRYSEGCSDVATFRTAESDTTYYQFMWLSDLHAPKGGETYINRVGELIDFAQAKDGVDLDFVLFTGDMVNKGQIYRHWQYWSDSGLMNDMTYAFVCGNHDYYGWNNKDRTTNDYYKEVCAYPDNSTEGTASVLDSNYWFIWNRVLFICIDNFTQESAILNKLDGSSLSAQQAWFKAVADANEGKYDYLIFSQHLPFFNTDTNTPCEYGNFNSWYKIFDQYKVDFALSSDEHTYRRTYPLYNKRNPDYVSASNPTAEKAELIDGKVSKGTVYVVSNQTEGSSISGLRNTAPEGLKYIEYTAGGIGGVYFTVTPTEMTLHLIGSGGREYDTITVLRKTR